MDIETLGVLFAIIFGLFGLVGGIPQLMKWTNPKPHLKINNLKILSIDNKGSKYYLKYEIENQSRFYTRDADATNVRAEITQINKNHVQTEEYQQKLSLISTLNAGVKFSKPTDFFHYSNKPQDYPDTITFKVFCDEGGIEKKKIKFECSKNA
jgi:hypothetical protein